MGTGFPLALSHGTPHISGSLFLISLMEPETQSMRSLHRRFPAIVTLAVATFVFLTPATTAAAQFGGLKKKIKPAANQQAAATPADQGGTIVFTEDVVTRLLTGLEAGQAEREAAMKEDTPYGRFKKADAADALAIAIAHAHHRKARALAASF